MRSVNYQEVTLTDSQNLMRVLEVITKYERCIDELQKQGGIIYVIENVQNTYTSK
jgi:hypothetical protein